MKKKTKTKKLILNQTKAVYTKEFRTFKNNNNLEMIYE